MEKHKPANKYKIYNFLENMESTHQLINTFTYTGKTMEMVFGGERDGCYLYSRHMNPSSCYLAEAIAKMENTEAAHVSASEWDPLVHVSVTLQKWRSYCK